MTSQHLTAAIWATNLSYPVSSMEDWARLIDNQMMTAKKDGASLLLLPEYASEQWLHFAGRIIPPTEQIAWMAGQVDQAIPLLQGLAKKNDMLLCAGTFACAYPQGSPAFSNRAHVFFPDGRVLTHNKLCLTPKEKNPEGWHLSTGSDVVVFEWQGWKIAVFICLDIELPALSAKIAAENLDLILVPSMTKKLAGYHRVFDCAKARAVELQAAIGVCGAIGNAPGRNPNISGCAFYLPCEEEFGHTGVLSSVAPAYDAKDAGPLLTASLPLGAIRKMREGGAEVWPGAFSAENVKICKNF